MTDITAEHRMLIDGELVDAASGAMFANVNPATEEVIGEVADGGVDDMERAIAAARRAFDETEWSTDRALRKHCLQQLKDALVARSEELRPQLVAEVGTPIALTYAVQQDSSVADMQHEIDLIDSYTWEYDLPIHDFMGMRSKRRVYKEAVGVCGAITPWNFPFMLNLTKVAAGLAAGNTMVLKPAPDTPWSATWIGKIAAEETDLPPGVLNVVTSGNKAEVGEMLTGDPRVDMISFTGSSATGRRIMANGADTLKRVFLELGGKSANVILDDADFASVVPSGAMTCMHAGQGCAITTRMLLPESRYDEGVELLEAAFKAFPYGDPTDVSNMMGPLINESQRDKVLGYIEKGKAEGARLVVGGGRPPQFEKGWWVEPTLFVDVDPDATIAQEEIFGPVLAVLKYTDDDDAVRIANNSRFGLSGGVVSASLDRALGVAKRIRTGTVSVNGGGWFGPDAPFGGYKDSGIGREHGIEGFEEYLEIKTVGLPADAA
ncbi:MAG TPA: aldehyde dehydrogenase family protein [Acidimicrobiia bacterium]|nr:aldehyde dehydrogenase family protein [Acidimicrobiia bacterium]